MLSRKSGAAGFALAAAICASCRSRSFNAEGTVKHASGQFIRASDASLDRHEVDRKQLLAMADFRKKVSAELGSPRKVTDLLGTVPMGRFVLSLFEPKIAFLPEGDARSLWLNGWMQKMDAAVRKADANLTAGTPRPMGIVLQSEVPQGFVSGFPVCLTVNVEAVAQGLEGRKLPSSAGTGRKGQGLVVEQGGTFVAPGKSVLSTLRCALASRDAAQLLAERLAALKPQCGISLWAEGLKMKQECLPLDAEGNRMELSGPTEIRWQATMNAVFVTTALFDLAPKETDLVTMVAHETLHYYRAHQSSLQPAIAYFYDEARYDGDAPPPTELNEELMQAKNILTAVPSPMVLASPMAQAQLPLDLLWKWEDFKYRLSELCLAAQDPECEKRCKPAVNRTVTHHVKPSFGGDESMLRDERFVAPYLEMEARLKTCLSPIAYTETVDIAFEPNFTDLVRKARQGVPYDGKNVWQYLVDLKSPADDLSRKFRAARETERRLLTKGLGFYTSEQEADEGALDLMVRLGFEPSLVRDSLFSLFRTDGRTRDADEKQCRKLVEAGFKDARGNPIPPDRGADENIHHLDCYRIYNLFQEHEKRHTYAKATSLPAGLLSDAQWLRLKGGR